MIQCVCVCVCRYVGLNHVLSPSIMQPIATFLPLPHSQESYEEWRYVYYLGATIYAIPGALFLFFSSSNVQSWAIEPSDIGSKVDLSIQVFPIDNLEPSDLGISEEQMKEIILHSLPQNGDCHSNAKCTVDV